MLAEAKAAVLENKENGQLEMETWPLGIWW